MDGKTSNRMFKIDWFEIFLRVDPNEIFNCILVCKAWLDIIIRPDFRSSYAKRWNNQSKLLSFLEHMKPWPVKSLRMRKTDTFESMCRKSNLMLFCNSNLRSFFVINYGLIIDLPPPPLSPDYPFPAIKVSGAIISHNTNPLSFSFRVVLASIHERGERFTTLQIQEFYSVTGTWEVSETPCERGTSIEGPGFASTGRGTVYWRDAGTGLLISYDTNNREISRIPQPFSEEYRRNLYEIHHSLITHGHIPPGLNLGPAFNYGVSFEGSIWCARQDRSIGGASENPRDMGIHIWVLDFQERWDLIHAMVFETVWVKNGAVLSEIFDARPEVPFKFVSFVVERRDCLYVELGRVLFLYHLHTQELERVPHFDGFSMPPESCVRVPLTVADLGLWPVSLGATTPMNLSCKMHRFQF